MYSKYNGAFNMVPKYATNHRVQLHCFCTRSNVIFPDWYIRSEIRKFMLRLYTALLTMILLVCICSAETNSMLRESVQKSLGRKKCNTWSNEDKWSKMLSWKIWDEADTEDPAFPWAYKCATCVKESQKFA